jgi:hypothetical protein
MFFLLRPLRSVLLHVVLVSGFFPRVQHLYYWMSNMDGFRIIKCVGYPIIDDSK